MPNGVHTLMQAVKPTRPKASIDRASRNTEADQLPTRHDPMLPLRKLSQTTINIDAQGSIRAFTTHIVVNARLVPSGADKVRHAADSAGCRRNGNTLIVAKAHKKRLQPAGTASGFDPLK